MKIINQISNEFYFHKIIIDIPKMTTLLLGYNELVYKGISFVVIYSKVTHVYYYVKLIWLLRFDVITYVWTWNSSHTDEWVYLILNGLVIFFYS